MSEAYTAQSATHAFRWTGNHHHWVPRRPGQTVNKDCKHCKANRSISRHPQIPEANCFWNPQWKGFRPKSICNQLEGAEFKARAKFTPELGGYPLSDSE